MSILCAIAICLAASEKDPTARELLERLASSPGEALEIIVEAGKAPPEERLEFLEKAGGRLSAETLSSAVYLLDEEPSVSGAVWAVEILHHLPKGHPFRLLGPKHLAGLLKRGDPVAVLRAFANREGPRRRELFETCLAVLAHREKDDRLGNTLFQIVTSSDDSRIRELAARALRGHSNPRLDRKVIREYARSGRVTLLEALGPGLRAAGFEAILRHRENLRRRGDARDAYPRPLIRLAGRLAGRDGAEADAALSFLRDAAIYERSLEERLLAVKLLERLADHPRFLEVIREIQFLQIEDPAVRLQMWLMLLESLAASERPDAARLLVEATGDPHLRLRLAASRLLRDRPAEEVLPAYAKLLEDPSPQVVSSALWSLYEIGTRPVIELIIDRLAPVAKRGGLPFEDAVRILTLLTGEEHGKDIAAWLAWRRRGAGGALGKRGATGSARGRTVVHTFFRHRLETRRPIFVVDVSRSMERGDGFYTRLEALLVELEGALRSLGEEARFALIAFSNEARVLPESPRAATRENVDEALRFVRESRGRSGTDYHAALRAALEVRGADTIYFLSDGKPGTGEIQGSGELLEWFRRENAERGLIVNTVGVEASGVLLERLAWENHGIYKPLDLLELERE